MGYIGTDINYGNLSFQIGTGDGSDTTPIAALDYFIANSASLIVTLDGVTQVPGTDYNTNGNILTFSTAPANGVAILILFLGRNIDIGTPGDATVTNAKTNFQPGTTFKGDGSSAKGKITINCEMNTHGVSIQSPAHSAGASYTLTLPVDNGNADEILKTDGSGVLSWTTDSGGGPSLGTNHIIRTNALTIGENITLDGTKNGVTYGPISITGAYVVTITSPSVWHIL